MEKVIRNGQVAVLYSPSFGAGWYTWNKDHPACLYLPKIVEMVKNNQQHEITDELMQELLGTDYFYAGGAENLKIYWMPEGTRFRIDEYAGNEDIEIMDDIHFLIA